MGAFPRSRGFLGLSRDGEFLLSVRIARILGQAQLAPQGYFEDRSFAEAAFCDRSLKSVTDLEAQVGPDRFCRWESAGHGHGYKY